MNILNSINLILISVAFYYLSKAVYYHIRCHESDRSVADSINKLRDKFEDYIDSAILSNPDNATLFTFGFTNWNNHTLYPDRYVHGARSCFEDLNDFCAIAYLEAEMLSVDAVAKSADGTIKTLSGVGKDYYPWLDIDRYAVKCFGGNDKGERCPVFKALRDMCNARDTDLISFQPNAFLAYTDDDGSYGHAHALYVGNGDGRCGPISTKLAFTERSAFKKLAELCESCPFAKKLGEAKDHYDCCQTRDDKIKCFHGGIIAFFKRLIRR